MNIKNLNNNIINAYKNIGGVKIAKEKSNEIIAKSGGTENVDKVEFDFGRSINAAKTDIAAAINNNASAEKISRLTAAYANDNCPVEASEIAATIVK